MSVHPHVVAAFTSKFRIAFYQTFKPYSQKGILYTHATPNIQVKETSQFHLIYEMQNIVE